MNTNEFELLKYQIELLKKWLILMTTLSMIIWLTIIFLENNIIIFVDILSAFSLQLRRQSEQLEKDGIKYFESHKEAMLSKYSHLDTTGFNGLSIENAPTFEAFSSLITPFLPEDVKPLILLKRTNRQGIHTDICEYLISESQK